MRSPARKPNSGAGARARHNSRRHRSKREKRNAMNRSLTIKTGQTHVQRYMKPLLDRVMNEEIDPSFVITHVLPLEDAPRGYQMFRDKLDNCEKVVLKA